MNSMPLNTVKLWGRRSSSLASLISIIVLNSSKPKMLGINTIGTISTGAVVQDAQAFRNCAVVNNPTGTMSFYGAGSIFSSRNIPVSLQIFCSNPQPTIFSFMNGFPKSLNEIGRTAVSGENWIGMKKSTASKTIAFEWDSDKIALHNVAYSMLCSVAGARRQPALATIILPEMS